LAELVLALVVALLAAGVLRQFGQISPRGVLLDTLALLPQWKFFGQREIAGEVGEFDDYHLLARRGTGAWQEVLCWRERGLLSALWDPAGPSRLALAEQVVRLGSGETASMTALPYLIVLRHCIDRLTPDDGEAVQFAVAVTRGRSEQEPKLAFLSAWHCA
jgi:hypothetical protein